MGERQQAPFDPTVRFVRLRQVRADGFIEFDFAIGEPELSVELILPSAAFHEFCHANRVVRIDSIEGAVGPAAAPRGAPAAEA